MSEFFTTFVVDKYNFWAYIVLMMLGLWAMIAKTNLVKKVIGMNIFQTAIILFYVSIGAKRDATIPILEKTKGVGYVGIQAQDYINPLPHVLMLTAIVVSVATLGVALALLLKVYRKHNTLNEDEILSQLDDQ